MRLITNNRAKLATLALTAAGLAAFPAAGQAATDFGSRLKNDPTDGSCKALIGPCTYAAFIQPSDPNGDPYSGGAPVDGVITKFRIRAYGENGGPGQVTFRLAQVTATPNAPTAVAKAAGTGPTVTIPADPGNGDVPVNEYAARLRVKKGDQLAIDTSNVNAIYNSNGSKYTYVYSPTLVQGAGPRASQDVTNELLVAARIEPDRDGDGFGDETQDGCATQKSNQGACDTTKPLVAGLTIKRNKSIRFRLSEAATVKLRVERKRGGKFRRVKGLTVTGHAGLNKVSLRKKLKVGRYRLVASATDANGNAARRVTKKLRLK